MRNYQLTKHNAYYIPHDLFMQIRYKLAGYDRLKAQRRAICTPCTGNLSDHTRRLLHRTDAELSAIEQSRLEILQDFSPCVYEGFDPLQAYWNYDYFNYMHRRSDDLDEGPSKRKWNYYKSMLSHKIASKLHLV